MIPAWGGKLPGLFKFYEEGIVNRYKNGVLKEPTKAQLKEIEHLNFELLPMIVVAIIDKKYSFGVDFNMHFVDYLLVGKGEDEPVCSSNSNSQEIVYFRSFVKNINDPMSSEIGDVGIKEDQNGILTRII